MGAINKNLIYSLFILLMVLLHLPAYAGWSDDMRLTYRGHEITPQIVARNDTVHVAWWQIAGDDKTSYLRSIDNGHSWENIFDLSWYGHWTAHVDLCLNGRDVFAGWTDQVPLQTSRIAYRVSMDGGANWLAPQYVDLQDHRGKIPGILALDNFIYLVYHGNSQDTTGYLPINFLYSSDWGQTWSGELTIGHSYSYLNDLLIKKCGASLYIVWSGVPVPELISRKVITVVSRDNGNTWSEKEILPESDSSVAQAPCISCDETTGRVVIGWMDFIPGDLYYRMSINGGRTWEPEVHVTSNGHGVFKPYIEFVEDTLWAVWGGYPVRSCLEFTKSTNLGITWSAFEQLAGVGDWSGDPWLSYDNGKLHLVWWASGRPPHMGDEIYYKRWESETGIDDVPKPENISRLESYPNPFNSSTIITYSNLRGGDIKIFDITGKLIRSINIKESKEGKTAWDARDAVGNKVSSGIYFARAQTPQGFMTLKLIYLK